jgi:hypothetical protein
MSSTNGNGDTTVRDRFAALVANATLQRQAFFRSVTDPRRNIDQECGYPEGLVNAQTYQDLYDREAVAARVVEVYPKETWQVQPTVYEDEDAENITEFEEAWDALGASLCGEDSAYREEEGSIVWEFLRRADELSGIGQFGLILLGFDDGRALDQPVPGVMRGGSPRTRRRRRDARSRAGLPKTTDYNGNPLPGNQIIGNSTSSAVNPNGIPTAIHNADGNGVRRDLLYIRVFPQSLVEVINRDTDPRSPRFGQPTLYNVTFNDPREETTVAGSSTSTLAVHWTRVIHVADNTGSSEVFGVPRMRPVLNRLLDLRKLYGGSAEMYWRGAFPGISLETHPQLGTEVDVDQESIKDTMEAYMNGLQRYLNPIGMTAKTLAPQVVDPTSQINVQIEAICIKLGIPKRVFMGSERGELASSQDDAAWNDRLRARQKFYVTPKIIVPFVDRLIAAGVLPEPAEGYCVYWPDLTSQTQVERANVMMTITQALSQYVGGMVDQIIPRKDYLTRIGKFTEEEAQSILDNLKDQLLQQAAAEAAMLAANPQLQPGAPGTPGATGPAATTATQPRPAVPGAAQLPKPPGALTPIPTMGSGPTGGRPPASGQRVAQPKG